MHRPSPLMYRVKPTNRALNGSVRGSFPLRAHSLTYFSCPGVISSPLAAVVKGGRFSSYPSKQTQSPIFATVVVGPVDLVGRDQCAIYRAIGCMVRPQ
jgi:hypothetical protein